MELGARELMTFGVAIATLATTWGVLKVTWEGPRGSWLHLSGPLGPHR